MGVKNDIRFIIGYFSQNLSTAMEYKTNFFVQTIFMVLNNTFFILFWYFLFTQIDNIRGWTLNDLLLIYAFAAFSYGFLDFFLGNWKDFNQVISKGELDFYLTLPKNELLHAMISKSHFSGLGDILFALCILVFFTDFSLITILLFLILSLFSSVLLFSLNLIFQSLAFFMGSSEGASTSGLEILISFSTYPISIFSEMLRFFFYFVIPIAFLSSVPVIILNSFSLEWLLLSGLISFISLAVSLTVFYFGLKRYESGNLVNIRV